MATLEKDARETREERLAPDFAAVAESLRRSTVHVRGRRFGSGSGVVWRSDGLIITNTHVASGPHARVELSDGRVFDAEVTKSDRQCDLTALKIETQDLPTVTVGDSDALRVGELALAVGNPFGVAGAVTAGIIHTISPKRWIQADVRLLPGNSGGPLANARGHVIGINTMIAGGLAVAVPSNEVERFLGRGRPLLGVTLRPVSVPQANGRVFGLLVLEVTPESLAEKAGLLIGDVLLGADGRPFNAPDDLGHVIGQVVDGATPEKTLQLELLRGGDGATCAVMLSEADRAEAA
jgi:serine protease Do